MPDLPDGLPAPATGPADGGTVPPVWSERLWPGALAWVLLVVLAAMVGIALTPVDPRAGAGAAALTVLVGAVVLLRTSPVVEVADGELHAGAARIPLAVLGEVRALDATQTRAELGPRLDARAHLCHRGWVPTAVRVEVHDPHDPTPYWIVSTRRPAQLVAAVRDA
ncbi:DUF3093 domain-containing protein [Cellulomonas sp.]|uniref:DUF3093 domain-containing protein n=1 Tax=Cellulomonas sp. TaxID=40001 RepID=UPI001B1E7BF0|nr:DUF3093 domain-containing protein [Cellulomonas sp.]MBO9555799.1 DUF3093 domain-containing protein [Cellulomonas sp.]